MPLFILFKRTLLRELSCVNIRVIHPMLSRGQLHIHSMTQRNLIEINYGAITVADKVRGKSRGLSDLLLTCHPLSKNGKKLYVVPGTWVDQHYLNKHWAMVLIEFLSSFVVYALLIFFCNGAWRKMNLDCSVFRFFRIQCIKWSFISLNNIEILVWTNFHTLLSLFKMSSWKNVQVFDNIYALWKLCPHKLVPQGMSSNFKSPSYTISDNLTHYHGIDPKLRSSKSAGQELSNEVKLFPIEQPELPNPYGDKVKNVPNSVRVF